MKKILFLLIFMCGISYSQNENLLVFRVLDFNGYLLQDAEVFIDGQKSQKADEAAKVYLNYTKETKSYKMEIKHPFTNVKKVFTVNTKDGKTDFPGKVLVFNQIATFIRLENHDYDFKSIFDNLEKCGVTDLFVETFYHGSTIYPSKVNGIGRHGDKDYLQMVLNEANKRGVRVHAWINTLYWFNEVLTTPNYIPKGALVVNRKNGQGSGDENKSYFASPNHPEVIRILSGLVTELVQKYPLLYGINFDYIRFKSGTADKNNIDDCDFGYEKATSDQFKKTYGKDPKSIKFDTTENSKWMQWIEYKENLVTNLLVRLSSLAKQKRDPICITADVFPDYIKERGKNTKCQNWTDFITLATPDYLLTMCYGDYENELEISREYSENVMPVIALSGNSEHDNLVKQFPVVEKNGFWNGFGIWYYSDLVKPENQKFLYKLMFK
jgi:hypothetical protein